MTAQHPMRAPKKMSLADQMAHAASERNGPPAPWTMDSIPASVCLAQWGRGEQLHFPQEDNELDAADVAEYELSVQVGKANGRTRWAK